MKKLFVFDLDGTLCPIGRGMRPEHIQKLQEYEKQGVTIALCSGKTAYYLCGFVRQMNLQSPWLIGENGAVLWKGIDLPPVHNEHMPFSDRAVRKLKELTRIVDERFAGRVWMQPNEVMLTPFFLDEATRDALRELFQEQILPGEGLHYYEFVDCFDVCPDGIDKSVGVRRLMELLPCTPEECTAIGDSGNDYPMFALAGTSIGIGLTEPERVTFPVRDLDEAFTILYRMAGPDK